MINMNYKPNELLKSMRKKNSQLIFDYIVIDEIKWTNE